MLTSHGVRLSLVEPPEQLFVAERGAAAPVVLIEHDVPPRLISGHAAYLFRTTHTATLQRDCGAHILGRLKQ